MAYTPEFHPAQCPSASLPVVISLLAHPELQVTLSVIEIYNERIRDLLDPAKDNLQVRRAAAARNVPPLVPPSRVR